MPMLLLGAALIGLGGGLSSAPLNTYPQRLFPRRRHAAVVAMHMAIGAGLAAGPFIVAVAVAGGAWFVFPLATGAAFAGLAWAWARSDLGAADAPRTADARPLQSSRSDRLWLFVAAALLYAAAESSVANWAVVFLTEDRGLAVPVASLALSLFWLALTLGRLVVATLVVHASPMRVWFFLAAAIAGALWLLPLARTPGRALAVYALAGAAFSGHFPLTAALACERRGGNVARVTAWLTAALATGGALGSFLLGPARAVLPLGTLYRVAVALPLLLVLIAWCAPRQRAEARDASLD
jgi:MFS transporter, FHS family, glucose/mannose:H+ symporter